VWIVERVWRNLARSAHLVVLTSGERRLSADARSFFRDFTEVD
jgi:hypothetical protein